MQETSSFSALRAQADHPDTDCVAYVDEIVPLLLDVAEASYRHMEGKHYLPDPQLTKALEELRKAQ